MLCGLRLGKFVRVTIVIVRHLIGKTVSDVDPMCRIFVTVSKTNCVIEIEKLATFSY